MCRGATEGIGFAWCRYIRPVPPTLAFPARNSGSVNTDTARRQRRTARPLAPPRASALLIPMAIKHRCPLIPNSFTNQLTAYKHQPDVAVGRSVSGPAVRPTREKALPAHITTVIFCVDSTVIFRMRWFCEARGCSFQSRICSHQGGDSAVEAE